MLRVRRYSQNSLGRRDVTLKQTLSTSIVHDEDDNDNHHDCRFDFQGSNNDADGCCTCCCCFWLLLLCSNLLEHVIINAAYNRRVVFRFNKTNEAGVMSFIFPSNFGAHHSSVVLQCPLLYWIEVDSTFCTVLLFRVLQYQYLFKYICIYSYIFNQTGSPRITDVVVAPKISMIDPWHGTCSIPYVDLDYSRRNTVVIDGGKENPSIVLRYSVQKYSPF